MPRLYPQSLFGRLIVTLIIVLVSAQIFNAALLYYERDRSISEIVGLQSVDRISAITRLLNELPTKAREQAVQAFSTSGFQVTLNKDPIIDPEPVVDRLQGTLVSIIEAATDQQFPVRVQVLKSHTDESNSSVFNRKEGGMSCCMHMMDESGYMNENMQKMMSNGKGMKRMMYAMMGRSTIADYPFLAQLQLRDGTWVSFMQPVPDRLFQLSYRIVASLIVILLTAVLLSYFIVRWITRPIASLATAAKQLGQDIQHPPLDESGPKEVVQAAHAFNTMQTRIKQYVKDRSQMLAAISHDLKTPITRLRLRAEMLQDTELKNSILCDLDDMQVMVSETLEYMRGQHCEESAQLIDINSLLESLVQDMQDSGYHSIRIMGKTEKVVCSRLLALKRCINNLLSNATRYGQNVSVCIEELEDKIRIRIQDQGPGVPEDQLEHIFEPFYRVDRSRNRSSGGTGLGLGIARDIARGIGGELQAKNRMQGGFEVVLELPFMIV